MPDAAAIAEVGIAIPNARDPHKYGHVHDTTHPVSVVSMIRSTKRIYTLQAGRTASEDTVQSFMSVIKLTTIRSVSDDITGSNPLLEIGGPAKSV